MNLRLSRLLAGLALILLPSAHANPGWHGYINDKTFEHQPYGYLYTLATAPATNKLRLICVGPNVFKLYPGSRHGWLAEQSHVWITIDSLPAMRFDLERTDDQAVISNQSALFWTLVAQMVAGSRLKIETDGGKHQFFYDLSGFTDTYARACGWLDNANRYKAHLDLYR